jgi:CheY-like chemotaxis protein
MIKKKILIADDDKDTVKVLKMALEMRQFEIITAFDGAEAVDLAKKESPDIILLDVMMPVYDGFMVNKILKKDVGTKDIPVFVITARSEAKELFEEKNSRIDAYCDKPVSIDIIVEKIKELLK